MPGSTRPIRVIRPSIKRIRFAKVGEFPANIRPAEPERLDLRKIAVDDGIILSRRGLTYPKDFRAKLEARAAPDSGDSRGSVHERIVYRELNKRQIPFDFQSSFFGARARGSPLGGLIADFVLLDRPLIIQVQGYIWHAGREAEMRDAIQKDELFRRGFYSVELWDHTIENEDLLRVWFRQNVDFRLPWLNNQDAARFTGRK